MTYNFRSSEGRIVERTQVVSWDTNLPQKGDSIAKAECDTRVRSRTITQSR